MALTYLIEPQDFGRCYDTNRLVYKISSDNYTQPNFRFHITLWAATDFSSYVQIATVRKRPLSDGTCYFNPAEIYSNYLTSDCEINITGLTEALHSNMLFRLITKEEYGDPPSIQSAGLTSDIKLTNGLQEYIPYDITAYGGGNDQWFMSGITWEWGWWDKGDWNYESTQMGSSGKVMMNYQVESGITNLTNIVISYMDKDGVDASAPINHISAGDYVKFVAANDSNKWLMVTFDNQTQSSTGTTWEDITFISSGATIPSTGFTHKETLEVYATNTDEIRGYGKFLTNALDFQVADYDYANLYFITGNKTRPTYCRVKVFYWAVPMTSGELPGGGIVPDVYNIVDNPGNIFKTSNTSVSTVEDGYDRAIPSTTYGGTPVKPIFKRHISSYYTGYTLTYTTSNNYMYYIPTGPVELAEMGLFDKAGDTWVAYQIDLTNGLGSAPTIFNKYPMTYYRKLKCNKYGPMQLFWLNPHGGFDRYTFYKKNYTSYEIERTIWEHRFSPNYVLGERGTTVYKTKAVPTITLNTDYLSASETQVLAELEMTSEVYAVYQYAGVVYKIPYIVVDTKFQVKDLRTDKASVMEINIQPAWSRTSQTS
jgi:hypothetical protein